MYNGSQLTQMSKGNDTLYFIYDAEGTPVSVKYNGVLYNYVTNLQGDVTAILTWSGQKVVSYTYDAWGKQLSCTGSMSSTLGTLNPLRYRGYVYDQETELYYLQSRYYNPKWGRFINADAFVATGQGFVGNNMFAYCGNNPMNNIDPYGMCFHRWDFWNDCPNCHSKGTMEKIYDIGMEICKKTVAFFKGAETLVKSIDAYVGVGLGTCGSVTVFDGLDITAGLSYDVIGMRLNDGSLSMSQRSYNGADISLIFPLWSFSEETYREFSFSNPLPPWKDDTSMNYPVFSIGAYIGLGGTISIAIDFNYLQCEWDKIHIK